MRTPLDWDYTRLADAYVNRPGYAPAVIDALTATADLTPGASVVDLGAGTGHLTVELASRQLDVFAVEPNDRMRAHGRSRTAQTGNVRWVDALMEDTHLPGNRFALTSFGSSFGVADPAATLREAARLLLPDGWFCCMWNHRDLEDTLQSRIESYIREVIPEYQYGMRREDPTPRIAASGLFGDVLHREARIRHRVATTAWVEAWRSHATLQRQAGDDFASIVDGIDRIVREAAGERLEVPYTTRMWMARRSATGEDR
jgi:SAM-dependent methyltransferase